MNRPEEHMENIFKQKFENFEAPVPEFLWERIINEQRKRKNRFFKYWIFMGLSFTILSASIAAVFVYDVDFTSIRPGSKHPANIESHSGERSNSNELEKEPVNNSGVEKGSAKTETRHINNNLKNQKTDNEDGNIINLDNSGTTETKIPENIKNAEGNTPPENNPSLSNISLPSNIKPIKSTQNQGDNKAEPKQQVLAGTQKTEQKNSTSKESTETEDEIILIGETTPDNPKEKPEKIGTTTEPAKDSITGILTEKEKVTEEVVAYNEKDLKIKKPIQKKKKGFVFIDVSAGFSIWDRSASDSNRVSFQNGTVAPREGYNVELGGGYFLGNGLGFGTGLSLLNFSEEYNFKGSITSYDSISTTSYEYHDRYNYIGYYKLDTMTFDTVFVITDSIHHRDSSQFTQTTITQTDSSYIFNRTNRYSYIGIPVYLHYRIGITERFSVTPSAGMVFFFLRKAQASWIDPNSNQEILGNKDAGIYNNLALSYRIGIGIDLGLSDNLSIFLNPSYTKFIRGMYNESSGIDHKPYFLNGNGGIRYKF